VDLRTTNSNTNFNQNWGNFLQKCRSTRAYSINQRGEEGEEEAICINFRVWCSNQIKSNRRGVTSSETRRVQVTTHLNIEPRTTIPSFPFEDHVIQQSRKSQTGRRPQTNHEANHSLRAIPTDETRQPLLTFSPMDKSYHSQNYRNGVKSNQYEGILDQMQNAMRSS
jgi:hypothetical protein